MEHAVVLVTDSGGIQEETRWRGIRCVTARENMEQPVTVKVGTNILVGTREEGIRQAARQQLESRVSRAVPEASDGKSARRSLNPICREIKKRRLL